MKRTATVVVPVLRPTTTEGPREDEFINLDEKHVDDDKVKRDEDNDTEDVTVNVLAAVDGK